MKKLSRKDHRVFVECEIFDKHFYTPWTALIYFKIVMMSNNNKSGCFVKPSFFEELFNLSKRTVERAINELIEQDYIKIKEVLNEYNEKIKVMIPLKFFGKTSIPDANSYTTDHKNGNFDVKNENFDVKNGNFDVKNGNFDVKNRPKNTHKTLMDNSFHRDQFEVGQKNRRIQKNIRTEERQTHEQKSISEIDWSNFDSNSSSVSDSDFFVSDISDSGLVKQLEEHMHESQAQDLIRKYGTQKVEIALNKVNNRNPANKGGYLMAMLKKDNETPTVKDQAAKEDKAKKEQLAKSEKNWNAINRSLNTNQAELKQFYQDLINKQKPNYSTINKIKTLLDTYPTGLINKPFDILLASRTISINYLKALLYQIETEKVSQYG